MADVVVIVVIDGKEVSVTRLFNRPQSAMPVTQALTEALAYHVVATPLQTPPVNPIEAARTPPVQQG